MKKMKKIVLLLLVLVLVFTAVSCEGSFKETTCPSCHKTIHYAAYKSGRDTTCKYCHHGFKLP